MADQETRDEGSEGPCGKVLIHLNLTQAFGMRVTLAQNPVSGGRRQLAGCRVGLRAVCR